ncbi:MAG: hypothetical protein H0T46_20125 [Deltaproteobacteria bacterium]|nr:hypothetical protein [Deltaproteobacteria bacterium]
MFLAKIWFFLVALVAAVAITIALVLPRPAQRVLVQEETQRLVVACGVIDILLGDDARNRVELAGAFSRTQEIVTALESASGANTIDEARMKQVREVGESVMKTIQGARKPDFAMLIDRRGRVVARVRLDENDFGDIAAGRPLVDDALAGFLRDDLWAQNGTMYFVSAAPVIRRDPPVAYVGAIVLGHQVTNALATKLVSSLNVDVGFYLGKDDVAGSKNIAVDHGPLLDSLKTLQGGDLDQDCQAAKPIEISTGKEYYNAVVARLPGEAALKNAFYSVLIKRPEAVGFMGTLKAVSQSDLGATKLLWPIVGGLFLVMLVGGIAFMYLESDRPLKRLTADAVRLAKGEKERLGEDEHPGKFGSIARSVNIAIDKLGREAKTAKKDLDQLLGPAPEGSLGTIDLLATSLPPARPGGPAPAVSPPPSDFRFHDPGPAPSRPATPPPIRPGTPAPVPPAMTSRPPVPPSQFSAPPRAPTAPPVMSLGDSLDDDILGSVTPAVPAAPMLDLGSAGDVDSYFKSVFDQFIAMKKSCGEPTTGLTYSKFSEKLEKNREDLIAKTGCKEVKFTVYVKDGKAALKATPVKDE